MPRSTIANRNDKAFDKYLEIRDINATALSATSNTSGLAFAADKFIDFGIELFAKAYTGYTAGSAEWALQVQASEDDSTYVTAGSYILKGTATSLILPFTGDYLSKVVANPKYIRINAVKTGSPGNLSYGAAIV